MRGVLVALMALLASGTVAAEGGDSIDVIRGTDRAVPARSVPRLAAQSVTVGPSVSVAVIRRVVRRKLDDVRLCYRGGLQRAPKLRGRVTVEFTVDPSGVVTRAQTASTTLPDAVVIQCVLRSFDSLVFPRLSAAILIVDYPLDFVP